MLVTKLRHWTVLGMLVLLSAGLSVVHGGSYLPQRFQNYANVYEGAMMSEDVKKFLAEHPDAIVKFYRPGCPFCEYVKPLYKAAKDAYSDKVAFLAVDISNDAQNLKREFGFATVPEFQYYKDGKKKRNHGSNNRRLKQADITTIIEEIYT